MKVLIDFNAVLDVVISHTAHLLFTSPQ